tara:strand:- start:582 stop:1976 length:1395 start_codon:yes stop_codon:yes gene_type:complete
MSGYDYRRMLDTIRKLSRRNNKITLYKFINKIHPSQMVNIYRHLHPNERINIFNYILRMDGAGQFVKELDETLKKELFSLIEKDKISTILSKMNLEDIAEVLQDLNPELTSKVEKMLNEKKLSKVEEVLKYEDESAGRIMTHEYMAFDSKQTVKESRERFRLDGENIEMPFYIYVVDIKTNEMLGITSLRQLLISDEMKTLSEIMEKDFIYVGPDEDQEVVAKIISEYNYLALPVLNDNNKLVGIITVDDVIDVIREEATEDMFKLAGAGDDEDILLKSVRENAFTRFPWLMASWVGGVLALFIISYFESMMIEQVILASFIPVIIGMGGNIGTQTSTIIVRGIATGHVNVDAFYKVIFKEIKVGALLGVIYGSLLGILGSLLPKLVQVSFFKFQIELSSLQLGLTVSLSIFFSMLIACVVASIMPVVLFKIGKDPAISTGPFVTTSIDILGIIMYFTIASILI